MKKARISVIAAVAAVAIGAVTAGLVLILAPPPVIAAHARSHVSTPVLPTSAATATATATLMPTSQAGSLVATAAGPAVTAYSQPSGTVASNWANPQPHGVPLTFLVVAERGEWLQVELPQRPNGSTGWIQSPEVTLTRVAYRLVASTEQNTLTLFENDAVVKTFTVATGTGGTPTPHGSFYLTELLAPTNAGYGPFAFGLSAFSDALSSFGGGPGQIGLHGTNDASSIGHSASHGCIRMSNPDITTLAQLLPLGTPIMIG